MPSQVEQVVDSGMYTQKPLSLPYRFESSHPPFPDPGRLMGLLCSIVCVPICDMDGLWNQLSMSNTITPQLVCHDLPGFTTMASYQALEETLRCCSIPLCLKEYINNFSVLVHGSRQIMLLAVNFHEHFIDEKCVTVASVFPL